MGLWQEGTQRGRRRGHRRAESDAFFVAAAMATIIAASLTLFAPLLGVGFDVVALLLVSLNLRRHLNDRAKDQAALIQATDEADVLRRVVEESPLAHLIARTNDAESFDVISINAACCELFGASPVDAFGLTLASLLSRRSGMERLVPLLVSDSDVATLEIRLKPSPNGGRGSLRETVLEAVVQRIDQRLIAVSFVDITERVLSNERLLNLALHDVLTGLPNRRLLAERLTAELTGGETSQRPTALVVLDLNEFKEVNDALGHDTGDHLLRAIANRLNAAAPSDALVARLGGDEFAVLLPNTTLNEAEAHAHRLAAITREPVDIGGLTLQIRASMGVVAAPDHGYGTADLMRLADVAMYASKRTGDDVTCYRTNVDPFSKRRVQLLGELESAIGAGQFEVFYQPIIDLVTGRIVSTEGLLRWRHPELGLIPPFEFIELAELTGVIGDLTRFVVGQVLRDNAVMERAGFPIQVSCNLSTRNLFEADFVEAVGELIELYGMPAGGLRLEITEGDVMEDVVKARQVMRALSKLGASLAIDDFGTGHSSLERLRDLPVSCVKIDQSFVRSLLDGPRSHTLLRDIITMLENLGFTTVAEGIEEESSRDLLAEFGCTHGQGYFWARPLPLPDFIGLLSSDEAKAIGVDRLKPAVNSPSADLPQSTK